MFLSLRVVMFHLIMIHWVYTNLRRDRMTHIQTIHLAGGCFWGVEEYYRRLKGVINTSVGYAQGHTQNPNYKEVCSGTTGYVEAVMVSFDTRLISLNQILDHLFRMIDPTLLNRQGNDIGTQYRTGIYPSNNNDLLIAKDFVNNRQQFYKAPIVTEVELLKVYVEAEPMHQMYLEVNPQGYCHIDFSLIQKDELK